MSGPVRSQPSYHFENTFAPQSGENIIRTYECQEACGLSCGPRTTIALTDMRLIKRIQHPNRCCCCCQGPQEDMTVFLHDIETMYRASQPTANPLVACLFACTQGRLPCFLCASCCGACCGDKPRTLEVGGGFGTRALTFKMTEIGAAANDITGMLLPVKHRK